MALCAPVLEEGATLRRVYLPPGPWCELASGVVLQVGTTIELAVTLGSVPLFLRAGAVLPGLEPMPWSDFGPSRSVTFDLFPGEVESSFALYEDDGDGLAPASGDYSCVRYLLRPEHGALSFRPGTWEGRRPASQRRFVVRLWAAQHFCRVELNGRALPESPEPPEGSAGWARTAGGRQITAVFRAERELALRFLA